MHLIFFEGCVKRPQNVLWLMSTDWVTDFLFVSSFFVVVPNKWMYFFNDVVLTYPICPLSTYTCVCVIVWYNQYHENNHRTLGKGVFWCVRTCICKDGKNDANSEWIHCMRVHGTTIGEWRSFAWLSYFFCRAYRFVIWIVTCVYAFQSTKCGWKQTYTKAREHEKLHYIIVCILLLLRTFEHKCQAFLHVN